MTRITIESLSPATCRALAQRAYDNGRSPAEEICAILEDVLCPRGRLRLGSVISDLSRASGLSNADVEVLEHVRAANPSPSTWFG